MSEFRADAFGPVEWWTRKAVSDHVNFVVLGTVLTPVSTTALRAMEWPIHDALQEEFDL